jgi:hypothetical protein
VALGAEDEQGDTTVIAAGDELVALALGTDADPDVLLAQTKRQR